MLNPNQLKEDELNYVNSYISKRGIEYRRREREIRNAVKFLKDNGFTDEHFSYEMKWETESGVRHPHLEYLVDVTYESFKGSIDIVYKRYDHQYNRIVYAKYPFKLQDNKIQCWCVTGNDRWYKPSTFMDRLIVSNERAEADAVFQENKYVFLTDAVAKYKARYPKAEVVADDSYWNANRIITITFPSKSRVWVSVNRDTLEESVHDYEDSYYERLSLGELLDVFNV